MDGSWKLTGALLHGVCGYGFSERVLFCGENQDHSFCVLLEPLEIERHCHVMAEPVPSFAHHCYHSYDCRLPASQPMTSKI
jgi:hypothetical protein